MRASELTTVILLLVTGAVHASTPTQEYVFGVDPTHGARQAARDWTPVLEFIERKTGVRLRFATARNLPAFSDRVEQEVFDFAVINPGDYVRFEDADGYRAIVRARDVRLKGVVVVRKDSPIERLEQLRAQSVAVPAGAFAADRVPVATLGKLGVNFARYNFAGSGSVYQAVVDGYAAAGGGSPRTLNALAPELREQLRVIWTSAAYTGNAVVAHARVPQSVITVIQNALIDLSDDPEHRSLLEPFAPAGLDYGRDEDWNDVRDLDL